MTIICIVVERNCDIYLRMDLEKRLKVKIHYQERNVRVFGFQ